MKSEKDNISPKIRAKADNYSHVALTILAVLLVMGIDFEPWFEARREISIAQARAISEISIDEAKAESKIKIMRMQIEVNKSEHNKLCTNEFKELKAQVKHNTELAHKGNK